MSTAHLCLVCHYRGEAHQCLQCNEAYSSVNEPIKHQKYMLSSSRLRTRRLPARFLSVQEEEVIDKSRIPRIYPVD